MKPTQKNAVIIPLLNGQAHINKLEKAFKKENVFGGVAHVSSNTKSPGEIKHVGKIKRLNVEQPWDLDGQFNLLGLQLEELEIGDLQGVIDWKPKENGLYTDIKIKSGSHGRGRLFGYLFPSNQEDQLSLNFEFNEMRINWLVPFFQKKISEIDGVASGSLRIEGLVDNPEFNGQAALSQGVATVDYLNTNYKFSGATIFDQNIIYFDQIEVFDRYGSEGFVTGQLIHENIKVKALDVKVDFQNLELLNTSRNQNTLYSVSYTHLTLPTNREV